MKYLVSRSLLIFEGGPAKAIVLQEKIENLEKYKKLIIIKNSAINAFLSYEQENKNGNSCSDSSPAFTYSIKPLALKE